MNCTILDANIRHAWQPDGDTFITIIFGLITTLGVLLSALQTFLTWRCD